MIRLGQSPGNSPPLISDADDLLAVFESLPYTLAHHDPQWSNLFAAAPDESPARTVVIDWGYFGIAPIGSDLGLHVGQNIMSWGIDQRRAAEHDQESTAAYLSGLWDYGWEGDTDSIKFARATAAAINAGNVARNGSELALPRDGSTI
jgi:thiamine kinase-like enzyme